MISCGYAKKYRYQELASWGKLNWDQKPDQDDIVKWIQLWVGKNKHEHKKYR